MTSFRRTKVKKTSKSDQVYRIRESPFSKGLQGYTRVSLAIKKIPEMIIPKIVEAVVWISAVVRIVICMFPQNNWCTDEGNMKLSIARNAIFAVTGIGVIILYIISGNANGYGMTRMVAAIILSFACYLPVTLFSKTKPKVGLLMIPKTCAYMWMIVMGLQLLF